MTLKAGFVDTASAPPTEMPQRTPLEEPVLDGLAPGFVEAEYVAQEGRIEVSWNPDLIESRSSGFGSSLILACGIALLIASWACISVTGFIVDQFGRSPAFGVTALALVGASLGLITYAIWAEVRAYRALRSVDVLRTLLRRQDVTVTELQGLCQAWLHSLINRFPEMTVAQSAVDQAQNSDEINYVVRHQVLPILRQAARQTGLRAAMQGGALVAISPSNALDGILAALRGLAVVRDVAGIFGLRPGPAVTIALLRRVAWTAAAVPATELAAASVTDALLEMPYLKHLAGAVTGSGLAAARFYRLAGITAEACSPLPQTPA